MNVALFVERINQRSVDIRVDNTITLITITMLHATDRLIFDTFLFCTEIFKLKI